MPENAGNSSKKNEKSHNSLIKVTFCKKIEMCVCSTSFKLSISPKRRFFFVRTFEKGGGAKKKF